MSKSVIKVKYGDFSDANFNRAFQKIANSNTFKDVRLMRNVVRIGTLLKKKESEVQETYIKLLKQFSILDEKGEFVGRPGPDGKPLPNTFQVKEEHVADAWPKAKAEFDALEVDLFCDKLNLHDLVNVGLTPIELGALECMIKDLNIEESKPADVTPIKGATRGDEAPALA